MGIIQSALSNVMSIQADPTRALQGASNSFTASANIASKIEDKLNKKAQELISIRQDALTSKVQLESKLAGLEFQSEQSSLSRANALERAHISQYTQIATTKLNNKSREKVAKIKNANRVYKNKQKEHNYIKSNLEKIFGKGYLYNYSQAATDATKAIIDN